MGSLALSRCLCPRSALLSWRRQRPSSHQLEWHRVTGKGELPAKALDWIGRLATGPQQGGQAEGQTLLEAWVPSVFGFTECRSSEAQRRVQASPRSSSRSGVTSCCEGPGARELLRAFRLRRVPRGVAGGMARGGGGRSRQQRVLALARAGREWSSAAPRQGLGLPGGAGTGCAPLSASAVFPLPLVPWKRISRSSPRKRKPGQVVRSRVEGQLRIPGAFLTEPVGLLD